MKLWNKVFDFFWFNLYTVFNTLIFFLFDFPFIRFYNSAARQESISFSRILFFFYKFKAFLLPSYQHLYQFLVVNLSLQGWPDLYPFSCIEIIQLFLFLFSCFTLFTASCTTCAIFKVHWPRSLLKMRQRTLISSTASVFLDAFVIWLCIVV
jgi:hypothetical protein